MGKRDCVGNEQTWVQTVKTIRKYEYFLGRFLHFTMWKSQDFLNTQILRIISLEDSRSAKTAVFAISRAVNFVNLVTFNLEKVQKIIQIKIQSL